MSQSSETLQKFDLATLSFTRWNLVVSSLLVLAFTLLTAAGWFPIESPVNIANAKPFVWTYDGNAGIEVLMKVKRCGVPTGDPSILSVVVELSNDLKANWSMWTVELVKQYPDGREVIEEDVPLYAQDEHITEKWLTFDIPSMNDAALASSSGPEWDWGIRINLHANKEVPLKELSAAIQALSEGAGLTVKDWNPPEGSRL